MAAELIGFLEEDGEDEDGSWVIIITLNYIISVFKIFELFS
jgi:hypothetical protein